MKDYTKVDWGEKRLPMENGGYLPEFKTKKANYIIRANHISPRRWTYFELFAAEISAGRSLQELGEWITEHLRILNNYPRGKSEFTEVTLHATQLAESMQHATSTRYNRALYLCTLFCVTEGEDLTNWNESEAEAKIDDWNNYGYSVYDFFHLAAIFTPKLAKELTNITASILIDSQSKEAEKSTETGA